MAGNAGEGKSALRTQMKTLRSSIPLAERETMDAAICERFFQTDAVKESDLVLAYLSFGAEVDTRALIERAWSLGKRVAIPRCVKARTMRWFAIRDFENLEKSSLGVEEPALDESKEVLPDDMGNAVVIVPGLAFDAFGYRLGYGGGFYDTFLGGFAGASVGLCRKAQFVDSLVALDAIGTYDLPVDIVVTEDGPHVSASSNR